MNILAIDYWTRKTWIAYNFWNIAMPLKIVDTSKLIEEIKTQIKNRNIERIVIWLAIHVDWNESVQSLKTKQFAKALINQIPKNISVEFHDERFSSFEAAKTLELAWEKHFNPKHLDDMAASIILESYLNTIN